MPTWIISTVIAFCVRQVAKFGANTNWTTVKADADVRVRQVVPGEALDQAAVDAINNAIDVVSAALQDQNDLKAVADAVAAGNWAGAVSALEALLANSVHPQAANVLVALQALKPVA